MSQTVKLRRSATSGSVPTTSALALGELAINTYDGKLYLKKNVSGTETVVEIGANNLADTFNVYEYAVTSNTTVFSGSDQNGTTLAYTTGSPPKVAVFLNGLLLDWGTDFTATNGTSVTLTSAAVSGDLVQIQAYKSEIYTGSNLTFPDNVKALFGNDSDLQIYHDGNHSYIRDVGTGNLHIDGTRVLLRSASSADMVKAIGGGAVELYHNAIKKFETTSTGATITGNVVATGGNSTQWNTAYTYSQVGHLPLVGGTLTGTLNAVAANFSSDVRVSGWLTGASDTNTLFSGNSTGTIIQTPSNTNNAAGSFYIRDSLGVVHFTLNTNTNVSTFAGTISSGAITSTGGVTINNAVTGDASQFTILNGAGATLRMGITGSGANEAAHIKTNAGEALEFHIGQASNATTPDIEFLADGAGIDFQGVNILNSSRNMTTNSRFTFDDNDHYLEAGTNSLALKNSGGTSYFVASNTGLSVTGALSSTGDLTVGGNLTVNGTTTTLNTATLTVDDLNITVADGAADAAAANGAGLTVAGAGATLTYTSAQDEWNFNKNLVVGGKETTASFPLMVKSNTAHQGLHIEENSGAESWQLGVSAAGDLNFYNSGSTGASINFMDNGNVGINNTNPGYKLDVGGSVRFGGSASIVGILQSYSGAFNVKNIAQDQDLNLQVNDGGTNTTAIAIKGTTANVGIGTSSPNRKLHISGSGGTVAAKVEATDGNQSSLDLKNSEGEFRLINDGGSLYIYDQTDTAERFRINTAGNVGINQSNPSHKLQVSVDANGAFIKRDISSNAANLSEFNSHRSLLLLNRNAGSYLVFGGNGSRTDIQATDLAGTPTAKNITLNPFGGNVGIGTDSPDTKLDITSAGVNGILLNQDTASAATSSRLMFKDNVRTNLLINVNGILQFRTDATVNSSSGTTRFSVSPTLVKTEVPLRVEEYQIDTTETSTSATTQTVIHTMSASVFRSARFTIQVTNSTDSTYHTTEILAIHDGTNANITEFGKVFTANEEATFDADVSAGNVRLFATPATTDSMEFKVVCHSITV